MKTVSRVAQDVINLIHLLLQVRGLSQSVLPELDFADILEQKHCTISKTARYAAAL